MHAAAEPARQDSLRLSFDSFVAGDIVTSTPCAVADSSASSLRDDEGYSSTEDGSASRASNDESDIPLAALAQAKAARELLGRDVAAEKRKMKAAAKRDSDIAQDTMSWRRCVPLPSRVTLACDEHLMRLWRVQCDTAEVGGIQQVKTGDEAVPAWHPNLRSRRWYDTYHALHHTLLHPMPDGL